MNFEKAVQIIKIVLMCVAMFLGIHWGVQVLYLLKIIAILHGNEL